MQVLFFFFLLFPFIVMMHFMISLLYSILSNDTFYQFSGEYWCFALLNMSFDFFDVPLLFSICFLVMLSFGGNFSLSPQRFFFLIFFFQELPWASLFPPCVWKCLTCDPVPPVGVGQLLLSPAWFRDFSMHGTVPCLQHPWGLNHRTIFKSKRGEKPTGMF